MCDRGCPPTDENAIDDDRYKYANELKREDGHVYFDTLYFNGVKIKINDFALVSYEGEGEVENELHKDEALVKITNFWYCEHYRHKFMEVLWLFRHGDLPQDLPGLEDLPESSMVESKQPSSERDELYVACILGKCDAYEHTRKLPNRRQVFINGLVTIKKGNFILDTSVQYHKVLYLPDLTFLDQGDASQEASEEVPSTQIKEKIHDVSENKKKKAKTASLEKQQQSDREKLMEGSSKMPKVSSSSFKVTSPSKSLKKKKGTKSSSRSGKNVSITTASLDEIETLSDEQQAKLAEELFRKMVGDI
eukprot:m.12478 g.12478  ORF g.12478 m.12478 type:complete len:306 (-) comp4001_c0_seq1:410-1327(-)